MSKSIYVKRQAKKQIQELEETKLDLAFECSTCILDTWGISCGDCSISKKLDDIDNSISYWNEVLNS